VIGNYSSKIHALKSPGHKAISGMILSGYSEDKKQTPSANWQMVSIQNKG
jgi:hypothetical protein